MTSDEVSASGVGGGGVTTGTGTLFLHFFFFPCFFLHFLAICAVAGLACEDAIAGDATTSARIATDATRTCFFIGAPFVSSQFLPLPGEPSQRLRPKHPYLAVDHGAAGADVAARRHLSSQAQSTSVPSTRKATRTWARHSSRFSPRSPVETTSIARMLRSELCACLSACCAASSEDFLELPTSSMIFTTATSPPLSHRDGFAARVLLHLRAIGPPWPAPGRNPPAAPEAGSRRNPLAQRRLLPAARLAPSGGRGGLPEEPLE